MEGLGWLAAIIVGGLAGWIASSIMKADTGIFLNIILGIVGAVVANFLLGLFGVNFQAGSWLGQGIAGLIGAVILIWIVRAVRR
ncbi:GlsB/YeaQ/YmgE family stress response membrane protein [Paracoccus sp. Z118]|uniref:GlsB/YeaQ/YmgE family stress response membrane protein n=1 Tax=Paracoccus sp. Z118 TaxID=2851017 RepID=UPI001C2C2205|nr:GlsB/YeaQ/YmgE family stress response membrane protein [Paracoccus sp. Z118]MBV0890261.1 GlsB/YeaQ/YmgE family stress response membrane protein [Paracoccus sp. Z118]